ncbi:MAG: hypothetical protein Q8M22_19565 [Actinomycetota bacterium]|nr:hypothetical protein [Actinomycetota bacterium]
MAVPVAGVASPAISSAEPLEVAPPSSTSTPRPASAASADDAGGAPVTVAANVVQQALRTRVESNPTAVLTIEVVTSGVSAEAAVAVVGGDVVRELDGLALVTVPARQVNRLAAQAGVSQVRLPIDMRDVMARSLPPSTEVGPQNSTFSKQMNNLFGPGEAGIGQRIGIIGLFDTTVLAQQVAAGELRPVAPGRTRCISAGATCPFGTPGANYGNVLAEIVTDSAPYADLYLAELGGGTDYLAVIDWMAANGVTTLLHHWNSPYDGAGDGTGFSAAVIDHAVAKGILWVNAAGELGHDPQYSTFAGPHWRGTWSDADNDRWLNFSGSDESLTAYCGALMGLRWNDWAASKTDYDLHVSDYRANNNTNGTRVLASGFNQGTGGAPPVEANDFRWLCNHDPAAGPVYDTNGDNFVSLWVYRTTRSNQSPVSDLIEITVLNGWLEHSNSPATIAVPFADTRNPGAVVVGASFDTNGVPWWTSRGPTNDGRIRPDIVADTCIHTSLTPDGGEPTAGCRSGLADTAGPAAAMAGYSAVLSARQNVIRPTERARYLIDLVRNQTQFPRSNDRGWGIHHVPDTFAAANSLTPANPLRLLPAPIRILETRPAQGLVGTSTPGPMAADTSVKLSLAGRGLVEGDVALLNVTLVTPPAFGWIQAYPPYVSWVAASSNLNVAALGETVPNLVAVRVDRLGLVSVYTSGGGHLVVDLLGSFSANPGPTPDEGRYVGLTPYQVADTTTCAGITSGCTAGQSIAAATAVTIPLGGTNSGGNPSNGIPTTGTYAAIVSVTATPGNVGGWASALPGNSAGSPSTSTLNFAANRPVTNMAIVPISSTNGSMRLFTSVAAHYRVDVLGYFRRPASTRELGGLFVAPAPVRLVDTRRDGGAPVVADGLTEVELGASADFSGTDDIWLNLTSTVASGAGRLQVAGSSSTALGNHVNLSVSGAGRTVASAAVTRLDDGSAFVRNSMSTHVIADLVGWFTPTHQPIEPGQLTWLTTAGGSMPGDSLQVLSASTDHDKLLLQGAVDSPSVLPGSTLTMWDRSDDTFTSIDVKADGTSIFFMAITAKAMLTGDGQQVVFTSNDNGIVAGDGDWQFDVFIRQPGGATELVSVDSAEQNSTGQFELLGVSDDGRFVMMYTSTDVSGWPSGRFHLRDRVAGTTTTLDAAMPTDTVLRSAQISPDGSHVVMAVAGRSHSSSGGQQSPISVMFMQLGGATTAVPYSIGDGFGMEGAITDVAVDGTSAVVRGCFLGSCPVTHLVGKDGSIRRVPAQQLSTDRTAAATSCKVAYDTCRFFTLTDGERFMHWTESGAWPAGDLDRIVFMRDGTMYVSSRATNLGPNVTPPPNSSQYYIYLYDPSP